MKEKFEMPEATTAVVPMDIRPLIYEIRGRQVMLDRDLAVIYHVMTGRLNEAVKRNRERFPDEFMFQLTDLEMRELIANCDRFSVMKHSPSRMYAFTEQGVAMLSAVLKSEIAVLESIRIIKAFVAMRQFHEDHLRHLPRPLHHRRPEGNLLVRCIPQGRWSPDLRRREAGRGDDPRSACLRPQGNYCDVYNDIMSNVETCRFRMNEIVIFVGIPASGKTSFYKERFFPSHVYVSQDQLRTSSAVEELFRFCIRRNKNCVIDKCNISVLDRQKYIRVAHSHGAKAIGYCFVTKKEDALARNAARSESTRVKEVAIRSAYSWMQYPKMQEGFDELYFVRIVNGEYVVEAWHETERTE